MGQGGHSHHGGIEEVTQSPLRQAQVVVDDAGGVALETLLAIK
jgi:hypothetical protein